MLKKGRLQQMKKFLAIILALVLCVPCFSGINALFATADSTHVYTIVTNPGQDSDTQINIGWFADYSYTNCYVQYTVASDTGFASAKTANGSYNAKDYLWFYNRYTTSSTSSARFTQQFLNYDCSISGLSPNTEYIYRICDGNGGYSAVKKFKTAGQDRFSMIWSSDIHITHSETSKINRWNSALNHAETMAAYPIGMHINTGDMTACGDRFYFWKQLYEANVMGKYTFAGVLGNHDTYDNMMDDDANYTKLWNTGKYFGVASANPKNGYTQTSARLSSYLGTEYANYVSSSADEIFTVDTGSLAGKTISGAVENLDGRSYWFIYNDILFIMFDYYAYSYSAAERSNAFNWANSVIAANEGKYRYLFAAEHINLFNGHGGDERTYGSTTYYDVYKDWLDKNNVDVFLCGDNHIYFRTGRVYANETTSDTTKGTYVIQSPAITNTSSYPSLSGAQGYGENSYASAGYMGVCVFDVDENGITLKCDVSTDSGSTYSRVETKKLDKVGRQVTSSTTTVKGLYTTKEAITMYETHSASSQALTTVPANVVVEVNDALNAWGRIRYNGYTGWINLNNHNVGYATSSVTAPEMFTASAFNTGFVSGHTLNIYTPKYGATIANGGWSFQYNTTITAVRDSTGAYKVTEQNADTTVAKKDTAIPANGCVLLLTSSDPNYAKIMSTLAVGKYFTADENKVCLYSANPGEENKTHYLPGTEPEPPVVVVKELVVKSDSEYKDDGTYLSGVKPTTSVGDVIAAFDNEDVRVTDASGNSVDANSGIGTGCVISLYVDGAVVDSTVVIITGDTNGDGGLTASDYIQISAHVSGNITLEDAFSKSADANADSSISPSDIAMLMAHINGTAYMY